MYVIVIADYCFPEWDWSFTRGIWVVFFEFDISYGQYFLYLWIL